MVWEAKSQINDDKVETDHDINLLKISCVQFVCCQYKVNLKMVNEVTGEIELNAKSQIPITKYQITKSKVEVHQIFAYFAWKKKNE